MDRALSQRILLILCDRESQGSDILWLARCCGLRGSGGGKNRSKWQHQPGHARLGRVPGGSPSHQHTLMSFSLLSKRCEHLPLRVSTTSVRYAGRKEVVADPRKENLRRVLYPANIRNWSSPVGTWRPDVSRVLQRAIPSIQAHETIERAWLLHKRHTRWKRNAELERKFECMRKAMAELEVVDPRSFTEANRSEDPRARSVQEVELAKTLRGPERRAVEARIRGLFPRELRPPPDTPSQTGWNYDWKPIVPPIVCESIVSIHRVYPLLMSLA